MAISSPPPLPYKERQSNKNLEVYTNEEMKKDTEINKSHTLTSKEESEYTPLPK